MDRVSPYHCVYACGGFFLEGGGGLWLQSSLCESSMPHIFPNRSRRNAKSLSGDFHWQSKNSKGRTACSYCDPSSRRPRVRHADIPVSSTSIVQWCSCEDACARCACVLQIIWPDNTSCSAGFLLGKPQMYNIKKLWGEKAHWISLQPSWED